MNKGLSVVSHFVNPTETPGRDPSLVAAQASFRWTSLTDALLFLEQTRATGVALIEQFQNYRVAAIAIESGYPVAVIDGSDPESTPFLSAIRDNILNSDLEKLWGKTLPLSELTDLVGMQNLIRISNNHCAQILSHFDEIPILVRHIPTQPTVLPIHRVVTTIASLVLEIHRLRQKILYLQNIPPDSNVHLTAGSVFSRLRLGNPSPLQRHLLGLFGNSGLSIPRLFTSPELSGYQLGEIGLGIDALLSAGYLALDEDDHAKKFQPSFEQSLYLELTEVGNFISPLMIEEQTRTLVRSYNVLNATSPDQKLEESTALLFKLSPDRFAVANNLQKKAIRDVFEYLLKRLTNEKPIHPRILDYPQPRTFQELTRLGSNDNPVEVMAFHIRGVLLGRLPFLYGLDSLVAALVFAQEYGGEWLRHLLYDLSRQQQDPSSPMSGPCLDTHSRNVDVLKFAWKCAAGGPLPEELFRYLLDSLPSDYTATVAIRI